MIKSCVHQGVRSSGGAIIRGCDHQRVRSSVVANAVGWERGTGGVIPGWSVEQRVGSSEGFIDGGYYEECVVSSFAYIFQSDNPRFVFVLSVD